MAVLRAPPLLPHLLSPSPSQPKRRRVTAAAAVSPTAADPLPPPARALKTGIHGGRRSKKNSHLARRRGGGREAVSCMPTKEGEAGVAGGGAECEYLVRESEWGVRRMGRVGEEMRRVALVQAEAFHVPVALFNDFFFDFFKVLYACLVAEEAEAATQLSQAPFEKIVGVVDCTVQDEGDILKNLQGASEYFYVSGIAVLPSFRRRKVGTALLEACEALALQWRHRFMALRAYEDDNSARGLYAKAGYRVVSRDPDWVTWVGRRRRVLMIKELPIHDHQMEQQ
ncbi:hypothetical protein ACP70R_042209 [Stipagrostis hirtigluma subsp. patula]